MKVLVLVLAFSLIAGCSGMTPMAELEQQALLTGDWSAVEQRERILQRRKARMGSQCPSGRVAVCESFAGKNRCGCVESDNLHAILAGRQY